VALAILGGRPPHDLPVEMKDEDIVVVRGRLRQN
jgi:hypothetical protein